MSNHDASYRSFLSTMYITELAWNVRTPCMRAVLETINSMGILNSSRSDLVTDRKSNDLGVQGADKREVGGNIPMTG